MSSASSRDPTDASDRRGKQARRADSMPAPFEVGFITQAFRDIADQDLAGHAEHLRVWADRRWTRREKFRFTRGRGERMPWPEVRVVRVTPFRFGGPEQEKRQKSCAVPSRTDLQKPRQIRGHAVSAL